MRVKAGETKEEFLARAASTYDIAQAALVSARERARIESQHGYAVHVNETDYGYTLSDFFDGSTIASYENGKEL